MPATTRPDTPAGSVSLLRPAIGYALAVADLIGPDLLSRPTPCRGWDLRMLLRHVNESLAALHEAAGVGRVSAWPAAEPSAADLAATFRDRARGLAGACLCPDRVIVIADRSITFSTVAALGATELALHGWDISSACGPARPIPSPLADGLLEIAPVLVGESGREPLFAPPVTPSPAAGPSDRLVAFFGRDPVAYRSVPN
jgi:uncharacterized protein (TIGR03086 family)